MCLDKSEGNEFSVRFDKAWATLKDYSDCLGIEVSERVNLSTMLTTCLAQQARDLAKVQEDVKVQDHLNYNVYLIRRYTSIQVYKTLMTQLCSCREKLNLRQKDLERAQQTATSDPTCKEDLTEVGDMEIDSDEETMETQPQTQQSNSSISGPVPPKMLNSVVSQEMLHETSLPQVNNSSHHLTVPPAPTPQIHAPPPHMLRLPPTPHGLNTTLHPTMNSMPTSQSVAAEVAYSYVAPPSMQGGFRPRPPYPQRFTRAPFTPPHSMMQISPRQQRMQTRPSAPPAPGGISLRYPFRGPPPIRGDIRLPTNMGLGPPQSEMMQFSNPRFQTPHPRENIHLSGSVGPGERNKEMNLEPTMEELKPSLDDRLQSLVVRNSLGSVLLQEYDDSEEGNVNGKPYTPSTTPLPLSPSGPAVGGDGDDESVTTPTPQLDMSPMNSEETGLPEFNPANPIMKALYRSPTRSPEETVPTEVGVVNDQPTSGGEGSLLLGVDTGMLQNILKKVQEMVPAANTSPPVSSSPSESLSSPTQTTPSVVVPTPPHTIGQPLTTPTLAAVSSVPTSASNIKITSSLTSLLDEIFPQLSKSLQERKRKQDPSSNEIDAPVKQPKIDSGGSLTPGGPDNNLTLLPPPPFRPNGPRPANGGFSPRGQLRPMGPGGGGRPPGLILRPVGPRPLLHGGSRPPGMILRPVGPRPPPPEGALRPRGPPFDGQFRLRGPPRPDGNFRLVGPPRPGMQLVGERPPFRPQNMNAGFRQPFPPHTSFQPRMPPVSNQNFSRPPFGPRLIRPPPVRLVESGMEPNHFPEKLPQQHDGLQSIPPQGMWP